MSHKVFRRNYWNPKEISTNLLIQGKPSNCGKGHMQPYSSKKAKRVVPITYHPPITKNLVCMPIPLCVYERERRIIKHRSDNCFFSVPSIITKLFRCIFYFQRRCRAVQSGKLKRPCICRRRCILPDLLVILARVHMNHNMFYL